MHFISPWHRCPWAVRVRTALPSLDGKSSDPFQHLQCLSMWVKAAREIHVGQGGLKYSLFFGVSNAGIYERREGIIDLLRVHILRHLFQDIYPLQMGCWGSWAFGLSLCGQAYAVREKSGLEGKVETWTFQEQSQWKQCNMLGRMENRLMLICEENKGDFRCLFPPEASCFPFCTQPAAFSLEYCLKQSLSPAVSLDVVTCYCSLSLGCEGAQAVCHLEVSLRSEVAALTAIRDQLSLLSCWLFLMLPD